MLEMNSVKKKINLYVDDWGLTKEINEAIINLSRFGALGGVSILVDGEYVNHKLSELLSLADVKIGLHFNITESKIHWTRFIRKNSLIKKELDRQYIKLIDKTDRVSYIDGHHHAHLLPVVSKEIKSFSDKKKIPVRIFDDKDHMGSYLLSRLYLLYFKPERFFICNYLTVHNLKKLSRLKDKIFMSKQKPLVVHVSADSKLAKGAKKFENFRYEQYLYLLDHLKASTH